MATFTRNVTKDARSAVVTAPANLTVTVDLTGVGFSVYIVINPDNTPVTAEYKVRFGDSLTFDVNAGDVIEAHSTGTGTITVTTNPR